MKHNEIVGAAERTFARTQLDRLQRELEELRERLGENSVTHGISPVRPQTIRDLVRRRSERKLLFGEGLFFDPAWDILLELFLAHTLQQRVPVSELGKTAAIPPTTTIRWIGKLASCGLARRKPDPIDARRVFIELTEKGHAAMQFYFGD